MSLAVYMYLFLFGPWRALPLYEVLQVFSVMKFILIWTKWRLFLRFCITVVMWLHRNWILIFLVKRITNVCLVCSRNVNVSIMSFILCAFCLQICEDLMTRCLAPDCQMGGLGCDNMTVCLVCFLHGRPYEDLIRRCSQPCIGGPVPHLSSYDMDLK